MTINSEPDVGDTGEKGGLARGARKTAGAAGNPNRWRRWTMTLAVLCWWLAMAGAGPAGRTAEAQIRGRFTVLPQQLRITEEDPAGGQYRVTLSRAPVEDVTVVVVGIQGTDLTVEPSRLTFTPENWEGVRTVTVTAAGDPDGGLDQVRIRHRATGGGFENSFVPGLLVVVADNDTPGLDLNPGALTVREEDAKGAAYTVALKTEPKQPVTVTVDGAAGTDVVLGQTALTFDATDWSVPQTVTVTARGDADAVDEEVKLVHRANGSYLLGATVEVLVTVVDDDEPSTAVEIRTDTASMEEGGGARTVSVTASYDGAAELRDVGLRIDVDSGTADRLFDFQAVESLVLTIPAGERSASGTFALTPVDDDVDENDETVTVGGVIFSPPGGLGLSVKATTVTITDDDTRGVTIRPSALTLEQGEGTSYTIALASQPTEQVTVEVVAPRYDGLFVRERSVVFGVPHWATPREVALYAKNDGTPLPDGPVVLTHGISGGDYEGMSAGTVAVTVMERVLPTITVEDSRASEGNDAVEFAVSLDAASTRQVAVSYGTYSPLSGAGVNDAVHLSDYRGRSGRVTFNPGETVKHVSVPLIDDDLSEAEESFEFSLTNPREGRLPDGKLSLTVKGIIEDDDPVPAAALALTRSSIQENGGTTSVTATLDHRSSVDTTVAVSATPVAAAKASDFVLGDSTVLTIPAGRLLGNGVVTITGVDNFMDAPDKTITVTGVATNAVGVLGPSALTFFIKDDDTASVRVLPESLKVMEGESAQYRAALTSEPTGTATVSVRGGGNTVLSVDKPNLTFTSDNWSTAQTVTVTAAADADTQDAKAMLVHTVRGGGYDSVAAELPVTVVDRDQCVLDVADAAGRERDGRLVFALNLSPSCDEPVTVRYGTADGTARAPSDYRSASGTLTFAAGESRKQVTVRLRRDCVNEEEEHFYLRLSEPQNAVLADAEAVGTITNHGAMPSAWLGRFGRTVADHLFTGVEQRLMAERGSSAGLRLGGWEVGGSRDGHAAAEDPMDALRRRVWGEESGGRSGNMTMQEFLDRSAFALKFGSGSEDGGFASMWGRGAFSRFDGREAAVSLDGEVVTGMLGGDYVSGRWLAGLAFFHSQGDGTYGMDTAAGGVSSSLSGIYPYLGYKVDRNLLVWATAGYGAGQLRVSQDIGKRYKTDMEMVLGAAGLRGDLVRRNGSEGFGLAAKADVHFLRASSDREAGMVAANADAARTRLGLEGSYGLILGDGTLTPSMEVGLRHDTGDAERGLGLDVGAGLEWSDSVRGLSAALNGHGLAAHAAQDLRDWGVSGSVRYDADRSSERGLWLSLRQNFGSAADGGMDGLPGRETLPAPAGGGNESARSRLNAETGYKFPIADGRFTGAPYLALGLSGGSREHRLGYRVSLSSGETVAFRVKIEVATRRSSGAGAKHDRAVMLGGDVSW